ncbi:DsbA family protein [Palleronia caenipelagi]|uniref:DsbA family protein n=1 Tax=Palleronia caenipelagi TaxID=2489174 RepID=A0A547Q9M2_9RHOB|nr:DsbA family protein [Palleronia caenipelagi]TRD23095.1 DsbA family protein [Palleronia caenipelagi]
MKTFFTALSLAALTTLPALAQDAASMSDAERTALHAEIRTYLLENPEVLMEAIGVLEQRQAEEKAAGDAALVADNMDALINDGMSWVGGNPEGDVTVVEFLDYRCGYCKRAFPEVAELIESDGNIRFIVKEFPILGEQSLMASRYAIATHRIAGDEAYGDVHDALMAMSEEVTEDSLAELSELLELDHEAITAEMSAPEVDARIAASHQLAGKMSIQGTPSFVIGDELVRGYVPLEGMREIVAGERG